MDLQKRIALIRDQQELEIIIGQKESDNEVIAKIGQIAEDFKLLKEWDAPRVVLEGLLWFVEESIERREIKETDYHYFENGDRELSDDFLSEEFWLDELKDEIAGYIDYVEELRLRER